MSQFAFQPQQPVGAFAPRTSHKKGGYGQQPMALEYPQQYAPQYAAAPRRRVGARRPPTFLPKVRGPRAITRPAMPLPEEELVWVEKAERE